VSSSEPGASLPKISDPTRRYFAWRAKHPHQAEDSGQAWAEAWRQAYWAGIRENAVLGTQLLEVVQRVEALEQRLRDLQASDDIEREMEEASAYWKSEVDA